MKVKYITEEDIDFFYEIKSDEWNMYYSGWSTKPARSKIETFVKEAIETKNNLEKRKIYIVFNDLEERVGYLYFLPINKDTFDVPVAIKQGLKGISTVDIIKFGLDLGKKQGYKYFKGAIREDNVFSMKAYSSCGIEITNEYYEKYDDATNKIMKFYKTYKEI